MNRLVEYQQDYYNLSMCAFCAIQDDQLEAIVWIAILFGNVYTAMAPK